MTSFKSNEKIVDAFHSTQKLGKFRKHDLQSKFKKIGKLLNFGKANDSTENKEMPRGKSNGMGISDKRLSSFLEISGNSHHFFLSNGKRPLPYYLI